MCQAAVKSTRNCGVCVKLRSLLRVHYKHLHSCYTVSISVTRLHKNKTNDFHARWNYKDGLKANEPHSLPVVRRLEGDFLAVKTEGKRSDSGNCGSIDNDVILPEADSQILNDDGQPCGPLPRLNSKMLTESSSPDSEAGKEFESSHDLNPGSRIQNLSSSDDAPGHIVMNQSLGYENTRLENDDSESKALSCFCGQEFKTARELRVHHRIHAVVKQENSHRYYCKICGRKFKRPGHLRNHVCTHGSFECFCGASFRDRLLLEEHRLSHKNNSASGELVRNRCILNISRGTRSDMGTTNAGTQELRKLDQSKDCAVPLFLDEEGYKKSRNGDAREKTGPEKVTVGMSMPTEQRNDKNIRPYKCKQCSKSFKSRSNLKEHEYIHFETRSNCCDVCEKRFPTLTMLNKHKKAHQVHIAKRTSDPIAVCKERSGKQRKESLKSMSFECPECSKTFTRRQKLEAHTRSHDPARPYVCDVCGKGFKQKGHLWEHAHIHAGRAHLCEACGVTFLSQKRLRRHRLVHHEDREFRCSFCHKGCVDRTRLEEHMRGHTGERPFRCEYCAKGFTNATNLLVHIRIHTGERPFKCDQCDFAAVQRSALMYHKLTHIAVGNFECSLCHKKVKTRSSLREHLRRHDGIKQHACGKCNKAFVSKGELRSHLVSHSDQRPHTCQFCSAAFKRIDHLLCHMRNHHSDRLDPSKLKKKRVGKANGSETGNIPPTIPHYAQAQQNVSQAPADSLFVASAQPVNPMQAPAHDVLHSPTGFPF